MYKSVFKKYLSVLTLVVVVGFLSMTLLQAFLATDVLAEEKRQLLQENAQSIAHHTAMSVEATPTAEGGLESLPKATPSLFTIHYSLKTPFRNRKGVFY